MIPKENNIIKNKKNTLDKKTWVNIICWAISFSGMNNTYHLLQGEYRCLSFIIVSSIAGMGIVILIMYLFYRYRIFHHPIWNNYDSTAFNYHENPSTLRVLRWQAFISFLFVIGLLLVGHYIFPMVWNIGIAGLVGAAVYAFLRLGVFLFEKVLKMNKVP